MWRLAHNTPGQKFLIFIIDHAKLFSVHYCKESYDNSPIVRDPVLKSEHNNQELLKSAMYLHSKRIYFSSNQKNYLVIFWS